MLCTVYEKLPSQQVLKRNLPASLQPFPPGSRSSNLVENISHSQVHDTYGKSHHYMGPSLPTHKVHKDHFGRSSDDDVIVYDNIGNRILPHSLMHGKSVSNMPHVSYNDPIPRPGLGEERAVGSDERLIYQAALQVFSHMDSSSIFIVTISRCGIEMWCESSFFKTSLKHSKVNS